LNDSPKWYKNMETLVNGQDKKDLNVILESDIRKNGTGRERPFPDAY